VVDAGGAELSNHNLCLVSLSLILSFLPIELGMARIYTEERGFNNMHLPLHQPVVGVIHELSLPQEELQVV
jgi:hypothetical protein